MPQNELNQQFQGQYEGDVLKIPQNSFKGVLENLSGNNLNSGYTFQNSKSSSGYSSGLEGGLEQHGDYKQGEAYIMHNGNLQPIFDGNQKGFSGKNNIQSQAPVEYVVVEVDDDSHGGKGMFDESFLLQDQNNFKGPNIGTMGNHPLLVDGGAAIPWNIKM
ncbi:uncharacterized protein CEXT_237091 [Caerostris extrusa]|uniref:Uncharacterized protein n=1 Tax=Caerostris extrusa TaxID=172846 RepID=A0AAV4U0X9_CAEEX|nr:uncharacterized protein CEXT_237091 [Caerostris extrusa]